ncbi:VOC family protein [Nocardia arizonensis]|uniref:VOC family protein n=1 Tax=Nocardia arizonensis TaxID=1141647 RepID=UPI0007A73C38|nr:VOC family protein [Nocardia arizonensis]
MTDNTEPLTRLAAGVWPCLALRDARATADFLVRAFGFELTAVYDREGDPSVVEHGELRWPLGGGVMFGSAGKDETPFGRREPGGELIYVVCEEPDALFVRAKAAGAEIVREMRDEDYGSRGFSARDPEGNIWSFGTYAGE